MASYCALQTVDERCGFAEIYAIRKPDDLYIRRSGKKALDQGQSRSPVNPEGLRLDLLDLYTGGAGKTQGNVAIGFRQRHDRYTAIVGFGARDHLVGGAQARVP